jgi:hypothetical protein
MWKKGKENGRYKRKEESSGPIWKVSFLIQVLSQHSSGGSQDTAVRTLVPGSESWTYDYKAAEATHL